jgi:hypothetical protein
MDGEGSNEVSPFMLYYDPSLTSLPPNSPTSLSISGITFVNCGSLERDAEKAEMIAGGAIFCSTFQISSVTLNIHNTFLFYNTICYFF